jgi:Ca2+-binding RTX toxin-like protein
MEVITGVAWENTFYEINVPENSEELLIELEFSHIGGDLDLYLYDSDNNLIESSDSTTDNELISISSPDSGTYTVAVQPYEVTGNTYELRWDIGDGGGNSGGDDNYESNNNLEEAYDLRNNAGDLLSTINGAGVALDHDYYAINVPDGSQQLSVELAFSNSAGDIDLTLYDSEGNLVTSSESTTDNESINISAPASGTYYLDVYPYDLLTANTYDLRWETIGGSGGDDNYESNNNLEEAYDFSNNAGDLLSTVAGEGVAWDHDYYAINVPENAGNLSVELEFSHSNGDIDLSLYDSEGNLVNSSVSTTDNESLNISAPNSGTYYLDVYPYEATGNTYDLKWETTGNSEGGGNTDSGYNIDLVFLSDVTDSQRTAFTEAAKRWEEVITGDIPDVFSSQLNREVDDLVIEVNIAANDGPNGVLGFARPTELRDGSLFPYSGEMSFDLADIDVLEQQEKLQNVVIHEMGHVIGIGTIWDNKLEGNNTPNPKFTGTDAINQYQRIFRSTDNFVPVEADGGPGTAYGHWDEPTLDSELMSGILSPGKNPLSAITIAALADLGYQVNLDAADDYDPFTASIVSQQETTTSFDFHANVYLTRGNNEDNDILGTPANDLIEGGAGNDLLSGLNGNDTLIGGSDRDTLKGGNGDDSLTGDRGRDSFRFNSLEDGIDVITDFSSQFDLISVSRSGFGGGLSRGTLDDAEFISVSSLDNLDDNFSLGFAYNRDEGILAYVDQNNDIPLTQIAVLEDQPRLQSSNIKVS